MIFNKFNNENYGDTFFSVYRFRKNRLLEMSGKKLKSLKNSISFSFNCCTGDIPALDFNKFAAFLRVFIICKSEMTWSVLSFFDVFSSFTLLISSRKLNLFFSGFDTLFLSFSFFAKFGRFFPNFGSNEMLFLAICFGFIGNIVCVDIGPFRLGIFLIDGFRPTGTILFA